MNPVPPVDPVTPDNADGKRGNVGRVHSEAIGFATKKLKTRYSYQDDPFDPNSRVLRDPALEDYLDKARVDWDHPCALPSPMRAGKGALTGARRAHAPPIFRPYTSNTRQHVVGHRKFTGMNHYGFAADVVESKKVPPFIPDGSTLAQQGCPEILQHIPALKLGHTITSFKRRLDNYNDWWKSKTGHNGHASLDIRGSDSGKSRRALLDEAHGFGGNASTSSTPRQYISKRPHPLVAPRTRTADRSVRAPFLPPRLSQSTKRALGPSPSGISGGQSV